MNIFMFAWRALRRDWRAGELNVIGLSVLIAVTSVTAIGLFTQRVHVAMEYQASELLAADFIVKRNHPLDPEWLHKADILGLQKTQTIEFRSMIVANEQLHMAELKAVAPGYPLRGILRVAEQAYVSGKVIKTIPEQGNVWLDSRLSQILGVAPGDYVSVGSSKLRIAKILSYEPDRAGNLFSIAPRLLMNIADLPATQLIQTGSKIRYRLLVSGKQDNLNTFRRWIKPRLAVGDRLLGVRGARPEIRAAIQRAERYLSLAVLVSVLLAGTAVAMAVGRYVNRQINTSAILRCLGATRWQVLKSFALQILCLGMVASILGSVLAYGIQAGLAELLSGLFASQLPPASPVPIMQGLLTGLVMLAGFALPPLMALKDTSPLGVLNRLHITPTVQSGLLYVCAFSTMAGLMIWQSADQALALYVLVGTVITLFLMSVLAYILIAGLRLLQTRGSLAWRLGVSSLTRRAGSSILQVMSLGLGIMVLLSITMVQDDLIELWQKQLPKNAPNHFVINIQPDQLPAVRNFFSDNGLSTPKLYPMVRGRLIKINGNPVSVDDYEIPRAKRLVRREFNLSWAAQLQDDNQLVAGEWWKAEQWGEPLISIERGIADILKIQLGDSLTYHVAGRDIKVTVTNIRTVEWDSFHVNFFAILPPQVLEDYPANYVTSLYLEENNKTIITRLVKRFANLTVIDVAAIIQKVRNIIEKASYTVEFIFIITLAAGLMVLFAAIQASHDARIKEGAILRTLGASHRIVRRGLLTEFAVLGVLAGIFAATIASALSYILVEDVLEFEYTFNPLLWVVGVLSGGIGVCLAGLYGTRHILKRPPLQTLLRMG